MGGQIASIPDDTETKPARNTAPSQHGVGCQGARKAKSVKPWLCSDVLYGPRYPLGLVTRETVYAARRPVGPGKNVSGSDKPHGQPCLYNHLGGFPQVHSPDRLQFHCIVSGAIERISRCSRSV